MSESGATYLSELGRAMGLIARRPNTLFVGQAVAYPGQAAFKSFVEVPMEKRIEMPVAEEFQMGFCTGLALEGFLPVCFYPRWDFMILALNQLVNHLDKMPYFGFFPKVLIRVGIGRAEPLDPGPQHCQDYSGPVRQMLKTIKVVNLPSKETIVPVYQMALDSEGPVILVEDMRLY